MTLQKKQQQNQNTRLVVVYDSHPNPREEFLCFRTRAKGKIIVIGNKFVLHGITEQEMIDLLTQVHEEKMKEYFSTIEGLENENEDREDIDRVVEDKKVVYDFAALMKLSLKELKDVARQQEIKGWSKLRKVDLVNWLLDNMI